MKHQESRVGTMRRWHRTRFLRALSYSVVLCAMLLSVVSTVQAQAEWPHVAASKDGTPISYEVYGTGEQTLLFVHGWSCDTRYWRQQVAAFSETYKVVLVDLAGHGHSGMSRSTYSMKAFGEDVQAVAEATGSEDVILVGHSMGGIVIAEAARLMPERVKGLIGVDTLVNIEYPMTREALDQMIAPLTEDFQTGTRQFVQTMLLPDTDAQLQEWIMADMSAAPSSVALSAMEEMMSLYISGDAAKIFEEINVPVMVVNADLWPIDYEANRRHMASFDAIVIEKADHFLMMNRSDEFNKALEQAIQAVLGKDANEE